MRPRKIRGKVLKNKFDQVHEMTRHLDLGCGVVPRNPFDAKELYGVDVFLGEVQDDVYFRSCNFIFQPLPFDDCFFDYVSAFDVLEHIPRNSLDHGTQTMRYPFVNLMNEIHRVLKPRGVFYAVTPAFPFPAAFDDPTHVNAITERTHEYFCGTGASEAYGFKGEFELIQAEWIYAKYAQKAVRPFFVRIKNIHKRILKRAQHFCWKLRAVK